jgi:hypothetical protein
VEEGSGRQAAETPGEGGEKAPVHGGGPAPGRRLPLLVGAVLVLAAAAGAYLALAGSGGAPFDPDRETRAFAAHPPVAVAVPPGMQLARATRVESLDPRLLDVEVDSAEVRVHGHVVARTPSSNHEVRNMGPALAAARALPAAVDASTTDVNVLVDARTPYRAVAPILFTLGKHELGRVHLVVLAANDAIGALPMPAQGTPSCWLHPQADGGFLLVPSPTDEGRFEAGIETIQCEAILEAQRALGANVEAPPCPNRAIEGWRAQFDAGLRQACFPSTEAPWLPVVELPDDAPFQQAVDVLEAATAELGRASVVVESQR